MKKSLSYLSLLAILLSTASCSKGDNIEYDLNIVTVNDLHGVIYEEDGHKSLAHLKAEINKIEAEDNVKNTIVIANGDMFQGTAISNLSYGRTVVEAMNEVGFDILGIGNHEFDWGIDEILKYFDGNAQNGESTAKLVNSNIYKNDKLLENSVPYSVIDLGFVKVGVVSYAPPQLKRSILKTQTDGYDFKEIEHMKDVMKKCKRNSDVLVANMHYGEAAGDSLNVQLMNYGADAIVNGHEHKGYSDLLKNPKGVDVPVVQNRDQLKRTFGLIKLKVKNGEVIDSSVENRKFTAKKDEHMNQFIQKQYEQVKDVIEEPLCEAIGDHRKGDYAKWAARLIHSNLGLDCGIINDGGIRNVNIYEGDTVKYSDVFNIMPFDNCVYIFELTGFEAKSISGIISCKNDVDISSFDDSKTYKVGIIDYVALKYSQLEEMMKNGKAKKAPLILRDMFVEEMREHGKKKIRFNPHNPILTSK